MHRLTTNLLLPVLFTGMACTGAPTAPTVEAADQASDELRGPGARATDARVPELGDDLSVLDSSWAWLSDGIFIAEAQQGPVIEAKFELNDAGALSLSLYPTGKSLDVDAERNIFQELAGDPTTPYFEGSLEVFADREHLLRSARDLTLIQLSRKSLAEVVEAESARGFVYWAIPTIRDGRAGFGAYTYNGHGPRYRFIDGGGSTRRSSLRLREILGGPGSSATDARVPELGEDLSVLRRATVKMGDALAQAESEHGPVIEAKYELDDQGNLSLSIYPIGKGLGLDAERNTFFELAGDPTGEAFAPEISEFDVPDAEHLTRSARDLTIVQTAGLSLREAVGSVERAVPGGFVYWAIPTIRDTRSGFGIYVLDVDGVSHYYFVS